MSTESSGELVYRSGHVARRHARVPVNLTVRYQVASVGRWVTGKSVNMSLGGLCIAAEVLPPVGTPIEFEIFRRDKPFVHATGVVRWIRPEATLEGEKRSFGIEISAGSDTTTTRVAELIDAHVNGRLDAQDIEKTLIRDTVRWRWVVVGGVVILLALGFIVWSVVRF